MLELDAVRINRDEVVAMRRQGARLCLRVHMPWRELPHFVLLPDRFMLRWEHLDDEGLPVRLRSWRCRAFTTEPAAVDLEMNLLLVDL